jgi:hypothetical protein
MGARKGELASAFPYVISAVNMECPVIIPNFMLEFTLADHRKLVP